MGEHDKTHRIIFKICIYHQQNPLVGYCVTLNRVGNDVTGTTRPRDRRKRTVDLRVGDSFSFKGRQMQVVRISAQADLLLTAAQAEQYAANLAGEGYVYRLPAAKVVACDRPATVG